MRAGKCSCAKSFYFSPSYSSPSRLSKEATTPYGTFVYKLAHRAIRTAAVFATMAGAYVVQHETASKWQPSPQAWSEAGLDLPSDTISTTVGTRDGGIVHLLQRGEGRPILLLHGVTLSAKVWAYQLQELAPTCKVIAVDLRGHGLSKAGNLGFTIEQMADDLATVLEALDLTETILVGHSMGGMVALEYAMSHHLNNPKRVAGMLLVSTSANPLGLPSGHTIPVKAVTQLVNTYLSMRANAQRGVLPAGDLAAWLSRAAFGRFPLPAHVQITQLMLQEMSPQALAGILPSLAGFDRSRALGRVNLPTRILVGTADLLTPPFHARALVTGIPNSSLKLLSGAGHMLMLEQPGELRGAIREMIDGTIDRPT